MVTKVVGNSFILKYKEKLLTFIVKTHQFLSLRSCGVSYEMARRKSFRECFSAKFIHKCITNTKIQILYTVPARSQN